MAIDLGKQIGPLPLGAWVAVVGTGLGIVVWARRNGAPVEPEEGTLGDLEDELQNVGRGGSGWSQIDPPEDPPLQGPPADNEEWGRRAITRLIALGYDPAMVNQAITKALAGTARLSIREWALWSQALAIMGAPPYPVTVRPPGGNPPVDPPNDPPNNPPAGWGLRYRVRRGDTLKRIAVKAYNDESKWHRIFEANRRKLDNNPNKPLTPGMLLFIPKPTRAIGLGGGGGNPPDDDGGKQNGRQYFVMPGDTLKRISKKAYGNAGNWERIYNSNKAALGSPPRPDRLLRIGLRLWIPQPTRPLPSGPR